MAYFRRLLIFCLLAESPLLAREKALEYRGTSELVRIIESVLLLNNYALIPGRAKDRKGD